MYVAPLDDSQKRPRLPRTLDPVEVRILGSLAEKQLSTPEYYPLTVNALVAACNQKSNREPVMELSENEVQRALDRLQDEKLVWKVMGGRAVRYDHNMDALWHIDSPAKALLTLLFLRGPQTAGEMRGRSDRLHSFDSVADVESRLRNLYTATWFIASTDGPGSAHDWLMEPNPTLANRTPAELLRGGETPAPAWFATDRVY